MTVLWIALGVVAFFVVVYLLVNASGLGLAKKRIEDDPELQEGVDRDDLEPLPTDVEY